MLYESQINCRAGYFSLQEVMKEWQVGREGFVFCYNLGFI